MQFHMNGFIPGDPDIADPVRRRGEKAKPGVLPHETDVLIVGTGPTGLTLAAQLSRFADIKTCIVEQREDRLLRGQADGISCRSMEMFQAFGFAERVLRESYWCSETTFWKPITDKPSEIARSGRIQDVEDGLSEMPHTLLNQARVHDFYLDIMHKSAHALEPHYARRFLDLTINRANPHPVEVRFERLDEGHKGEIETIKARYVVGCDGARSAVRGAIGRKLEGEALNQAWGVMDVLPVSDFPDIRRKSLIQSAGGGSLIIIPREGGYLTRIYVEMDKLDKSERVANRNFDVQDVIAATQKVMHPYRFEVKDIAWWSVYEIGQRMSDHFDDVRNADDLPCVFIAGDACHTHSPKAGQGMNTSMQDGFNLGWKLASVLRQQAAPHLLKTYSEERVLTARQLINFDREWASLLHAATQFNADGSPIIDPSEVQRYFVQHGRYTAGVATQYQQGLLVGPATHQHLAKGFTIGMRFHSAPVIRAGDSRPMQLGHCVEADGRFRLFLFADAADPRDKDSALAQLCDWLVKADASPLRRYTPSAQDVDALFDVRSIVQQSFQHFEMTQVPPLLFPQKGQFGVHDYEKVFCPDFKTGPDIFDLREINRHTGCVVIVRPDQYIGHVLPLQATHEIAAYFDAFMKHSG